MGNKVLVMETALACQTLKEVARKECAVSWSSAVFWNHLQALCSPELSMN